ncbi:MAG: hypothetical protein PW788_14535 [Micavibrio sp.]|nr:hypothetical protein [Micavibrio sp.]
MKSPQPRKDIPPKFVRISKILALFAKAPPFANGMMAYATLMEIVNEQEDLVWGADYWKAPRTFHGGVVTDRVYPTHTESFENVEGFLGVTHLIHTKHSIFLSRYGAVQVQLDNGWAVSDCHLETRAEFILVDKLDAYGDGVWHEKNRK